jgi:NADPH:quinone reductase-like Zn-dependent oxidoreductase
LVKVRAATVTAGDCEVRRFDIAALFWLPLRLYIGVRKPARVKVFGQELAGEVESVGRHVTRFREGDEVFGFTGLAFGSWAEYNAVPESLLATKPAGIGFAEAAAIPTGGSNALHFLRKAQIRAGEKILINGAGGSIGTFAVQLAKSFGADVTAVDSAAKLDMLRAIGADQVIDYAKEDFTDRAGSWDVIFDIVGTSPFSRTLAKLTPSGRYLLGNPTPSQMLRGLWVSKTSSKKVIFQFAGQQAEDLKHLADLIESGQIKPVMDRSWPLDELAEAHRYVEQGHKKGNVSITVSGDRA